MSTNRVPTAPAAVQPAPRTRRPMIFVLARAAGFGVLVFVFGAAVMFFELPPSDLLAKAFIGCRAWFERSDIAAPPTKRDLPPSPTIGVDKPQKTCDGFTLCTFAAVNGVSTQAFLFDTAMPANQPHQAMLFNGRNALFHCFFQY